MKNTIKMIGIIATVAIITFGFTACGDGSSNNNNNNNNGDGGKPFLVELTPSSITFPPAVQGYDTQSTKTITVKNTGTDYTGNLSVTIVKDDGFPSTDFVSPATSTPVASIAPNANGTFNIRPADGLSAGENGVTVYTATVNVFNGNGDIHESIEVSFWVGRVFTSIADFKTALDDLPTNTAETAYLFGLNISDFGFGAGSLSSALSASVGEFDEATQEYINTKYVSLDMSGSTFTTIPQYALRWPNLVGITIPNSVTSIETGAFYTDLRSITFLKAGITLTDVFEFENASNFLKTAYENGGAGTYIRQVPNISWVKQ